MARSTIEIHNPLGGLDRNWAYQSQPPYTLADGANFRLRDVFESRSRVGSRPGLIKSFCQNVSTATETESFTETFVVSNDAYIFKGDPGGVQGGNHYTGRSNSGASALYRSLYYFNLTSILGSNVTHCNMKLGSLVGVFVGSPSLVSANRITQTGWIDTQVSWNNYATATAWAVVGGGGDFATTDAGLYTMVDDGGQHNQIIDITLLARDAVASRGGHLHVLLKKLDESVAAGNSLIDYFNIEDPSDLPAEVEVTYEI